MYRGALVGFDQITTKLFSVLSTLGFRESVNTPREPLHRPGNHGVSCHTARQKAANLVEMPVPPIRPNHSESGPVRSVDHGRVGHVDPFAFKSDAIMAILGFPIDIVEPKCVGSIAAG